MEIKYGIKFLLFFHLIMLLICKQMKSQSTISLPLSKGIEVSKYILPGDDSTIEYSYHIDSVELAWEEFYKNGKPIYWSTFVPKLHENGLSIAWYPNGQVYSIANFINGQKIGNYLHYYENGKLKEKGSYWIYQHGDTMIFNKSKVDTVIDSYGNMIAVSNGRDLKDGEWIYYSEKGVMIRKEKYVHGKLMETLNYKDN